MGASLMPRLWPRTVGPKTLEMDELVLALPKSYESEVYEYPDEADDEVVEDWRLTPLAVSRLA